MFLRPGPEPSKPVLRGRRKQREVLEGLVSTARSGRGAVLVLRGDPGVGRSALLDHMVDVAAACRIVRLVGVASQVEFTFAALQQLCAPLVHGPPELPAAQAEALAVALGLRTGALDQESVASAVLTLLSEVAKDKPLVCLVDDAQWLDAASAETLCWVARRLGSEPVVLVFAVRTGDTERLWSEFPQLTVPRLTQVDASELLESALSGPLDERVRRRLLAESRGDPSALAQLPRRLSPAELMFGTAPTGTEVVLSPLEEGFRRQLQALPEESGRLLVLAAAEPLGDVGLLWRAAEWLGIEPEAALGAEAAGLIEFGETARLQHPLMRLVAYRCAPLAARRLAHRALAAATVPGLDPDRQAWHRAQAVTGPDEEVAAALEHAVDAGRAHGGSIAAAILLERAAMLTPHPADRARRQFAAAKVMAHAGMLESAAQLVVLAGRGPLNQLQRARVEVLRAQLRLSADPCDVTARSLVASVQRLERLDAKLAVDSYLDALMTGLSAGRLSRTGLLEIGQAARTATLPAFEKRETVLLQAVVEQLTGGPSVAAPLLRRAVAAFDRAESYTAPGLGAESLSSWWLASVAAAGVWDFTAWDALTRRYLTMARSAGCAGALSLALTSRVYVDLFGGDLTTAASRVNEIRALEQAAGSGPTPCSEWALAAFRGHRGGLAFAVDLTTGDVPPTGGGAATAAAGWAEAVLCNGHGQYARGLKAGLEAAEHPWGLGPSSWGLAEVIEGAVRGGDRRTAAASYERLARVATASGTNWAMGVLVRSGALLAHGQQAQGLFVEAIDRLGSAGVHVEAARARLLYGEWLRREGRRREARVQLRTAHDFLSAAGVEAFARRARRELAATGEQVSRRRVDARQELTAQELHVVSLAGHGLSNPEIGAELFISPRTVEWHMGKALAKLGVRARRDLPEKLQLSGGPRS